MNYYGRKILELKGKVVDVEIILQSQNAREPSASWYYGTDRKIGSSSGSGYLITVSLEKRNRSLMKEIDVVLEQHGFSGLLVNFQNHKSFRSSQNPNTEQATQFLDEICGDLEKNIVSKSKIGIFGFLKQGLVKETTYLNHPSPSEKPVDEKKDEQNIMPVTNIVEKTQEELEQSKHEIEIEKQREDEIYQEFLIKEKEEKRKVEQESRLNARPRDEESRSFEPITPNEHDVYDNVLNHEDTEIKSIVQEKTHCIACGIEVDFFSGKKCKFCDETCCFKHIQLENHDCRKTRNTKYIRKKWLRKKGINVSSGLYKVECDHCGYLSDQSYGIEVAGNIRLQHIRDSKNNCPANMVFLEYLPDDFDREIEKSPSQDSHAKEQADWLYDCLHKAQEIINTHHSNQTNFFSSVKFSLFFQEDKPYAMGYIDGTYPFYPIGIHKNLSNPSDDNKRMIVVILVHELLHAIHHDWGHDRINPEERKLANLAGYFDALHNMEIFYLSGNFRFCDK